MRKIFITGVFSIFIFSTACAPSVEQAATMTSEAVTNTAAAWTSTFTSTDTLTETPTRTSTNTFTPTETSTPSITPTPTITLTPTFALPTFTVTMQAHCRYGPAKAYLHAGDLYPGDTGKVWGVDPMGRPWLYVKMDKYKYPCYVAKSVIDVQGDLSHIVAAPKLYLPHSTLYGPVKRVSATREGDKVTVEWARVSMTVDDDRGYFIEGWFCQKGAYFWSAVALPDQYSTTYTFTDEAGCKSPSKAKIYVVEKHGYTDPVDIPWPAP